MNIDWILPSQKIITDRHDNETNEDIVYRHEIRRRVAAESDLIKALNFIETLNIIDNNDNKKHAIENFLAKFLE
jgi:hypothetical protein